MQMSLANTAGNENLSGDANANTLDGGAGNDNIDAGNGNDILIGGTGDDNLGGSGGNDTYRFTRGDGQDVIKDPTGSGYGGFDTIEFAAGISASDLTVVYGPTNGSQDLILKINGTTDQITIVNEIADSNWTIEQVKFADGTTLGMPQLLQMAVANNSGNDSFYGSYQGETIDGGVGDDVIDGRSGDDIIIGGAGNDSVGGANGNDIYRFARGDGQDVIKDPTGSGYGGFDTIEFAAGISASDLTVVQSANSGYQDLILKINGTTDQVTISNEVVDSNWTIEQVKFADGTTLGMPQLLQMALANNSGNDSFYGSYQGETIGGGAGDDVIDGRGGDDIIIGGTGNDFVGGSSGNDTYRFARGDGQDVIKDPTGAGYGGFDTIEFAAGISASDLTVVQSANSGYQDIILKINGTTDQVTISNELVDSNWTIEQVKFADGTSLNLSQLVQMSLADKAGNNSFYGSYQADSIDGGAGNDVIDGRGGDDIIIGGAGDDFLGGSSGNDTYRFARGDGQDVIKDPTGAGYGGNDTIEFAAGISASDLTVVQGAASGGQDLIIKINGTNDQITIVSELWDSNYCIEQVRFADGSTLSLAQLVQMSLANNSGNNSFYGSYQGETIDGGPGNDVIAARDGNDVLIGGNGDDYLDGGSGTDVASYASAVTAVTVNLGLTTSQYTGGAGNDTVANIENLTGSAFDDSLVGSSAANVIIGGAGNDLVNGGAGTDIAKVAGLRSSYTLQTVNGQVQLVDNDVVTDGNDGTDTLVGIETIQFKDQSLGIVSPIILNLDGNGIHTLSASASGALFDMNGDGTRDDTSWIAAGNGYLFLDRDGDGTLSGIGEMSFTGDLVDAKTDLEGLAAFDTNGDHKLSAADARFGDFRIWNDSNGDGVVDTGEVLRFADVHLTEISLHGETTTSTLNPGDVALVNVGTWTRADGRSMQLGDAVMTYNFGSAVEKHDTPVMRPIEMDHGDASRDWDFEGLPLHARFDHLREAAVHAGRFGWTTARSDHDRPHEGFSLDGDRPWQMDTPWTDIDGAMQLFGF
jgi:Ca2+-binding RTX toxin-like protein